MQEILFHYRPVNPTTWVYLSSLLMIGLFFKFGRLWSLRNLDLIGLILLAPGILLAEYGTPGNPLTGAGLPADALEIQYVGYLWLFTAGGLFLIRLLIDPMMVRRPLLEPNLSVGGMTFIGVALFIFLMANVLVGKVDPVDESAAQTAGGLFHTSTDPAEDEPRPTLERYGPGYPLLFQLHLLATKTIYDAVGDQAANERPAADTRLAVRHATLRLMAILSHLAVVVGMVAIGYQHFDNYRTGIAAATLYLMLPYTAQKTGDVLHVLPAALLVWAFVAYRRPLASGMLVGLAIGSAYYPIFLLPLWISFYWRRGMVRFVVGVLFTISMLTGVLFVVAWQDGRLSELPAELQQMFGFAIPALENLEGFWRPEFNEPVYRYPVLAAFIALSFSLALWPPQKNLGTLMSCSAAVMLGTQFWHAHGGGLYMSWYLPLLLLTIFRPNLEDRIALAVLPEGRWPRWRFRMPSRAEAA
jgi:hypothetical protein